MKVDKQSLTYIENVVKTAQMVGIDNVIIEPGKVRAIDEDKKVVLFQEENVPELSFGSIGFNRISIFLSRLDLAKSQDGFAVEALIDNSNEFARGLLMTAKGTKVDYRCANPKTIQAPKQIKDELVSKITVNPEAVFLLQKGQSAMGADSVSVISNKDGVSFELIDINGDRFTHNFADNVTIIANDADTTFVHKYPLKVLLPLLKENPEGSFSIGKKGILNIIVNNLSIFVLPQV